MSKETEAEFDGWETEGFSGDEVHHHFKDFGLHEPTDIYIEACRLLSLLTKTRVDSESVYGQIFYGVACHASHGAIADVAEMFGLDASQLERTVDVWNSQKKVCKVPISPENFIAYHRAAQVP